MSQQDPISSSRLLLSFLNSQLRLQLSAKMFQSNRPTQAPGHKCTIMHCRHQNEKHGCIFYTVWRVFTCIHFGSVFKWNSELNRISCASSVCDFTGNNISSSLSFFCCLSFHWVHGADSAPLGKAKMKQEGEENETAVFLSFICRAGWPPFTQTNTTLAHKVNDGKPHYTKIN